MIEYNGFKLNVFWAEYYNTEAVSVNELVNLIEAIRDDVGKSSKKAVMDRLEKLYDDLA